jgi:hypothetical protein
MNEGWKCPVCEKVWGPHVDGCAECNGQHEYKWKYVPVPYYPTYPSWWPPVTYHDTYTVTCSGLTSTLTQ